MLATFLGGLRVRTKNVVESIKEGVARWPGRPLINVVQAGFQGPLTAGEGTLIRLPHTELGFEACGAQGGGDEVELFGILAPGGLAGPFTGARRSVSPSKLSFSGREEPGFKLGGTRRRALGATVFVLACAARANGSKAGRRCSRCGHSLVGALADGMEFVRACRPAQGAPCIEREGARMVGMGHLLVCSWGAAHPEA